ncbi:hypothetical protein IQ265_13620 [Nodosilinea sp. LEGE 06152]|uniref:hypothetical protein n=1 Tax=Nodosilinea sp. LEGE 06152 TaxID=2777966 RepID=UPI00187E321B|nr:hypothetical protein [Nodosilinea sp. LEGE 06152]MBE9157854.1 hypothetical protein [Nodosilinea sp. LEGE 06152]
MTQPSQNPNSASESAMAAEHDLLAAILHPEPAYPWQPLAPEAEGYLANLETEFDALADDDLSTAIAAGWQTLAAQITTQMDAAQTAPQTAVGLGQMAATSVLDQLRQFQGRLPNDLLQSLANSATTLARSGQPLIDQLVQCAGDILPDWNIDDLAVLARPLAYSLRDGRGEIVELNLRAIPASAWDSLSDLEQARLTLTIASVALKAAKTDAGPGNNPSAD